MTDSEQFRDVGPEEILHQSPSSQKTQSPTTTLPSGLQAGIGLAVASLVLGLISLSLAFFVIQGTAVASLVLGLVSLPVILVFWFVIGLGPALIGIVLAIIHLARKLPWRAIAVWGLVLSALGFMEGAGFGVYCGIRLYEELYTMGEDLEDTQFEEYIGTAAPDMTLKDIEGNEITSSSLKGKCIVLDFFSTWCPPCKKEIPHFIRLRQTTTPDEVVIIGISNESAETLKTFADKHHINYPLVSIPDEELPEPYSDIMSVPTTFFISPDGIIEDVLIGYHSFEELKDSTLGSPKDVNETSLDANSR